MRVISIPRPLIHSPMHSAAPVPTVARRLRAMVLAAWALVALIGSDRLVRSDDWPQWRGPGRNAVSAETGLLRSWPAGGPKLVWRASGLGTGYSSVAVRRGRVFTLGRHDSDVVVTALDVTSGKPVWTRKIGTTSRIPMSTPTVEDERLYALDPDGELVCLRVVSGEIVWKKRFAGDFSGRTMSGRGYGESPLIDGNKLICTPGGADAALVALDKRTGAVLWKSKFPEIGPGGKDGAGFSSVVMTHTAGVRQYVQLMGRGVIGIDARDGRFLWAYNGIANETANIPTPVVRDDLVFAANGYTAGSVLLRLVPDGSSGSTEPRVKAEVVYALTGSQFQNHHGGFVLIGDYLFGGHGNNNGLPTCLEFKTGRVLWKRRGPGVGSAAVVYADGHLYFHYQNGVVALIEASERGYALKGTLEVPGAGGDSWAHPVVANGRLFLREQDSLWVYDLRAVSEPAVPVEPVTPTLTSSPALTRLRQLGVAVEPMLAAADKRRPHTGRPILDYARISAAGNRADPLFRVVFSDRHLTSAGTFIEKLAGLLRKLPGPMVVSLAGTRISDAGLRQLRGLNVQGLNLELCGLVTDAGMEPLQRLLQLRALALTGTKVTHIGIGRLAANRNLLALDLEICDGITDAACEPLGKIRQLKALVFKKTGFEPQRISDAGLEKLQDLTDLELLNLYGNKVTDTGMRHLERLNKLQELHLSLLPVTDAALPHLKPLSQLEHLELLFSEGFSGPKITGAGVRFLAQLTHLITLNLTGAQVTDADLERLRPLKELETLQLVRTRVSAGGIQAFQTAVPKCKIIQ